MSETEYEYGKPPEGTDIPEPEEFEAPPPDLTEDEIVMEPFDVDEDDVLIGGDEDREAWQEGEP